MVRTTTVRWLAAGVLFGLLGCGGASRVPVKGEVTYAGTPIDNGTIVFVPATSSTDEQTSHPKAGTRIENGKYEFEPNFGPFPGPYRVEVTWDKKTGRKVSTGDADMRDETKQMLPDKYNANSTLKTEVKSGLAEPLNFHLEK